MKLLFLILVVSAILLMAYFGERACPGSDKRSRNADLNSFDSLLPVQCDLPDFDFQIMC